MARQVFKTIPAQVANLKLANKNHWTDDNITSELFNSLRRGGEKEYPNDYQVNDENVRKFVLDRMLDLYDLDEENARILVDGAFSRPQTQSILEQGKTYGIFESSPVKLEDKNSIAAQADELLKSNPEKWGVLYGYTLGDKLHQFKNPIFVNNQQDINKYQNALGKNGKSRSSILMQGTYRRE